MALYDDGEDFEVAPSMPDDEMEDGEERERLKVEMQRLHMSEELIDISKATLLKVKGEGFKLSSKHYKDTNRKLDNAYWVKDNKLLIRGVVDFSQELETGDETFNNVSSWGLKRLTSLGFHSSRCTDALNRCNGDIGEATELLLREAFNLRCKKEDREESADREAPGQIISSDEIIEECNGHTSELMEQRLDEKLALESIYGSAFTEKIPDKVWELRLPLDHLHKYLPVEEGGGPGGGGRRGKWNSRGGGRGQNRDGEKEVCPFFLRGYCKFGKRCRKAHTEAKKTDDKHLRNEEEKIFILEIRFLENSRYPKDPCIGFISTPLTKFPTEYCIKITSRLMREAKLQAEDSLPSVFSLVSILESADEVDQIIRGPTSHLSLPKVSEELPEDEDDKDGSDINGRLEKPSIKNHAKMDRRRDLRRRAEDDDRLKRSWQRLRVSGEDKKMYDIRQQLPAWTKRDEIMQVIRKNQVVVISGATGCGKSTQVPQFILEDWFELNAPPCNIVCTQPRRISATGVADRVAKERSDTIGNLVGYNIRLESKQSSKTRLLFCTTGILLRRLESDPLLEDVTHIVVDEVHERSEESDFLLMILRDVLPKRKNLHLILMSATVNAELFSSYFSGAPVLDIPGRTFPVEPIFLEDCIHLARYAIEEHSPFARKVERSNLGGLDKEVFKGDFRDFDMDEMSAAMALQDESFKPAKPGTPDEKCSMKQVFHRYKVEYDCSEPVSRTLALMDHDKINYELIEQMLLFIVEGGSRELRVPMDGSILVFLPGMAEIQTLHEMLGQNRRLGKEAAFKLVPLHSTLTSEEQAQVFSRSKPGQRKIVLATNIAETSITIEDCVFVVEAGRMKERRFDPDKNMESLDTVWVSRANAAQRKGRAGRVRPGFCFHLYTELRHQTHMRDQPVPEIQRIPLEQMVLRIKILPSFKDDRVERVLSNILEPPSAEGISSAIARLQDVGALEPSTKLSPLGYHLARLPVDVRIGKILILGAIFRCLDAALTIAAALSHKSPFVSPFKERDAANRARAKFVACASDQITVMRAYRAWCNAAERGGQRAGWVFAQENYLGQKSLQTIASLKHQFAEMLCSIGFIPGELKMRDFERAARGRGGADGILAVTGQDINMFNENLRVVAAVLAAALYPNIVKVLSPEVKYKQTATGAMVRPNRAEDLKFKTQSDGYIHIHPSSICASVSNFETPYLVYQEKIRTSRIFVREVSMVPMVPMVLFGGTGLEVVRERGQFVLHLERGWIKFVCDSQQIAEILKELRMELELMLEEKIMEPERDLLNNSSDCTLIQTIIKIIS